MARGAEIRQILAAGHTISEVAFAFGVTTNTVVHHRDFQPTQTSPVPDLRHTVGAVRTREAVQFLLAEGLPRAHIARRLGISKSTVAYHARRLGVPRDERGARRYDWSAIREFYEQGHTMRECEAAFGFSSYSWHAAVKRGDIVARSNRTPDDELFVAAPRSRRRVKARLLEAGLVPQRCTRCGVADWLGRSLSLELHHINGDRHDNRLENLELLCPNCHSQTENFAGRNRRFGVVAREGR